VQRGKKLKFYFFPNLTTGGCNRLVQKYGKNFIHFDCIDCKINAFKVKKQCYGDLYQCSLWDFKIFHYRFWINKILSWRIELRI